MGHLTGLGAAWSDTSFKVEVRVEGIAAAADGAERLAAVYEVAN